MKPLHAPLAVLLGVVGLAACSDDSSISRDNSSAVDQDDRPPVTAMQAEPRQHSSAMNSPDSSDGQTGVVINGGELTLAQVGALTQIYRYAPPPGRYWYDTMSGAWGVEGREPGGYLQPGFNFGPLASAASAGNTGVFINGRNITMVEAVALQRSYGAVYPGRWWLDGRTGNFGAEGNPMPLGNLLAGMQSRSGAGGGAGGGDNIWSSLTGAGNSQGGCSYVNVGGSFTSSGCD